MKVRCYGLDFTCKEVVECWTGGKVSVRVADTGEAGREGALLVARGAGWVCLGGAVVVKGVGVGGDGGVAAIFEVVDEGSTGAGDFVFLGVIGEDAAPRCLVEEVFNVVSEAILAGEDCDTANSKSSVLDEFDDGVACVGDEDCHGR